MASPPSSEPPAPPTPPVASSPPGWLGIGTLLLIATLFGTNHVMARLSFQHGTNVATAVTVRSGVTAIVVLLLMQVGKVRMQVPTAQRGKLLLVGVLLAIQSGCLYSAIARIPVALALLAFNLFPFLFVLINWALTGQRPNPRTWVAMPVALIGLALALDLSGVISGASATSITSSAPATTDFITGIAFALGGSISFALVLYYTTRWLADIDGRLRTLTSMVVITVAGALVATFLSGFAWPVDGTGWLALILLTALYGCAITTLFVVLPKMGALNNSPVLNFEPIAALMMGWLILDQWVRPIQMVGALLVVSAIIGLSVGRRR